MILIICFSLVNQSVRSLSSWSLMLLVFVLVFLCVVAVLFVGLLFCGGFRFSSLTSFDFVPCPQKIVAYSLNGP